MDCADCNYIAQLENAQKRATILVPDLRDKCNDDRLRALNLSSLLYRKKRMDKV